METKTKLEQQIYNTVEKVLRLKIEEARDQYKNTNPSVSTAELPNEEFLDNLEKLLDQKELEDLNPHEPAPNTPIGKYKKRVRSKLERLGLI